MKHRPDIEQLQIGLQSAATALQGTEQEHPPRVVKQQVILCFPDEGRDIAHQRGVGNGDVGDGFGGGRSHG